MTSASPKLTLIVACTQSNGIGKAGSLPWRLPKEMGYFLRVTTAAPQNKRNAVIMGRTTWESIPEKFRPLKERINIVLTSRALPDSSADVHAVTSLSSALDLLSSGSIAQELHHALIIGGSKLYTSALEHPATDRMLVTQITEPDYECDTFFPKYQEDPEWKRASFAELKDWVGESLKDQNEEESQKEAQWRYEMHVRTEKAQA